MGAGHPGARCILPAASPGRNGSILPPCAGPFRAEAGGPARPCVKARQVRNTRLASLDHVIHGYRADTHHAQPLALDGHAFARPEADMDWCRLAGIFRRTARADDLSRA